MYVCVDQKIYNSLLDISSNHWDNQINEHVRVGQVGHGYVTRQSSRCNPRREVVHGAMFVKCSFECNHLSLKPDMSVLHGGLQDLLPALVGEKNSFRPPGKYSFVDRFSSDTKLASFCLNVNLFCILSTAFWDHWHLHYNRANWIFAVIPDLRTPICPNSSKARREHKVF